MKWIYRIFQRQPDVELIERLKSVHIERDDIIVVRAKQMLTESQKRGIEEVFRRLEIVNSIVILDEGIDVGVIRK